LKRDRSKNAPISLSVPSKQTEPTKSAQTQAAAPVANPTPKIPTPSSEHPLSLNDLSMFSGESQTVAATEPVSQPPVTSGSHYSNTHTETDTAVLPTAVSSGPQERNPKEGTYLLLSIPLLLLCLNLLRDSTIMLWP